MPAWQQITSLVFEHFQKTNNTQLSLWRGRPSQAVVAAMQQQSLFFRNTIGVWGGCWCGWHVTVGHGGMPFYLPCMAAVVWHFSNQFSFSNFLGVPTRSQEVSTCQSSCDLHHSPVLYCTAICSPSTLGFTCRRSGTNGLSAVSLTSTLMTVSKSLPSTMVSNKNDSNKLAHW